MKNKYKIVDDKVYIELTQNQTTIIDLEDLDRIHRTYSGTWYASYAKKTRVFYVRGNITKDGKQKAFQLHRAIMNITDPKIKIDHVNHNTLDNTKENLRICSNKENIRNSRSTINSSSIYKGVGWHKATQKWLAKIYCDYKHIHIGIFNDESEAARAYDLKAKELFGEFAYLNFPDE
jgi:hypothetical protein